MNLQENYFDVEIALRTLDLAAVDKELCSRSYIDFIEAAWPLVEPVNPFIRAWHVEAIADHFQAVAEGQIKRLLVSVPPGSSKSLAACVFFVPFVWTKDPHKRFIYGAYSDTLARRDSIKTRYIISSDWYQERWGNKFKMLHNLDRTDKFQNNQSGFRMVTTPLGTVTGDHADFQIVDDPLKPMDVGQSLKIASNSLGKVETWWNDTMSSRAVDIDKVARVVIMQRLHERDLTGVCLEMGGYEHLMLPMEFEPERKCFTSIGFEDPRTEPGELLCPARFSETALQELKKSLGSRGVQAQLQQNPTPSEGSIFKESYMVHRYNKIPKDISTMIQSWDCTFKEDGSSYVVGQVWGCLDEWYYLLDQVRERWGFTDTCKQIIMLSKKWPKAHIKLIEAKANGEAIMDTLKSRLTGLKAINPEGGKVARAHAVEPLFEAGAIMLPDASIAPWIDDYVIELTGFPNRANDDQVDSTTQALHYLQNKNIHKLKMAMENSKCW